MALDGVHLGEHGGLPHDADEEDHGEGDDQLEGHGPGAVDETGTEVRGVHDGAEITACHGKEGKDNSQNPYKHDQPLESIGQDAA